MMMILWWFLAVVVILLVVGWLSPAGWWRAPLRRRGEDSPEDIVKRRYARGELDRETYERMLGDLRARDRELAGHA